MGKMLLNGVEYVGGRNTGGASALEDLTDVNVSSITDGQILKYDSATSKWVNDDESGGTVTDVQVNGTTVVDDGVAKITSYKEVTLAEYEALPASKLTDGILYAIKDGGQAVDGFPPLIYSDEEREIGVWRDGKPLYQKVIKNISLTHNTWTTVFNGSSINASVKYFYGAIGIDGNTTNPYCNSDYNRGTNSEYVCTSFNTNVSIVANVVAPETLIYGIVQYTKTTDTAGSGTWTTDGTYAHHCTTTEKVIGTWTDKKPLYERYFFINEFPNALSSNWLAQYNVKSIKYGYIHSWDGAVEKIIYNFSFNTSTKAFTSTHNEWSDFIYLQYTKTTD